MIMTLEPVTPDPVQLDLPFAAESVSVARHQLEQWLGDIGALGERCDDARLLVSELVGNAVRHARPLGHRRGRSGVVRVTWSRSLEGTLTIAVTDGGGAQTPSAMDAAPGDTGGRGLAIVEHLAHRWWVDDRHEQTTVHAEIPLH